MKRHFFGFFIILVALVSCDGALTTKGGSTMNVTGKIGEILVVCDDDIWNSELKDCLDSNLTQFIMPYFPDVATFMLTQRTPQKFTKGVKRYRNTLFLIIDPNHQGDKGSIQRRDNVWANGQLVIDIIAKDYPQLVATCKYGLDEVHGEFDKKEWERLLRLFKSKNNKKLLDKVKTNFGIEIALPSSSKLVSERKNFYRIEFPPGSRPIEFVGSGTEDVGAISSGLCIYQYDYSDTSQFSLESLLRDRDTMLKYNFPHEIEGLYMGTQYDKRIFPEAEYMQNASATLNGIEVRGMFVFTGKPIWGTGGAFWSFHFVHPRTQKVITLSGYVDAPATTSWTHPLREVQAILKSVEIAK